HNSFQEAYNQNNRFDKVLFDAFQEYLKGQGRNGNQIIRNFVWSESPFFTKGEEGCTYHCLEWFGDNLSTKVQSLFSFKKVYKFTHCSRSYMHSVIEESKNPMIACMRGDYPIMKQYFAAKRLRIGAEDAMKNLRRQFEDAYHKAVLYKTREGGSCGTCGDEGPLKGTLIPKQSIPPFLIIVDPLRYIPGNVQNGELKNPDSEVYFPESFSLRVPATDGAGSAPKAVEYSLHARLYSTHVTGVHFFTIGKIPTALGKHGLFKIDNLAFEAKHLKNLDSLSECPSQLRVGMHTVAACYKLKQ
ncbi:hypothetical protein BD560DRAFT_466508, partial [Blakeslea trispora]